jgi:tetratricopeptide (TPR) repeat protein
MTLTFDHKITRKAAPIIIVLACVWFTAATLERFVIAVAADPRINVGQEMLETVAGYYPDSSLIQARLAARLIEEGALNTEDHEAGAQRVSKLALRAVQLSPWHYENWVLLAAAQELNGNLPEAESSLREALRRAPNHYNVRWRLANLLIREGKLEQAIPEIQAAMAAEPSMIASAYSLIWQAAEDKLETQLNAVSAVAGDDPGRRLALARFLTRQGRITEAAEICEGVYRNLDRRTLDRDAARKLTDESSRLIDELIGSSQMQTAAELWRAVSGVVPPIDAETKAENAIWNGGFELPFRRELIQFDWQLSDSNFAAVGLSMQARTGAQSLRIKYHGRNTTKLDGEIKKRVLVRPGAKYRLTCFFKTAGFDSPDGPQVTVSCPDQKTLIAATPVIGNDSQSWTPLSVEFVAPPNQPVLVIGVRQTPQFSYVDPTKGAIWFDDFSLVELP